MKKLKDLLEENEQVWFLIEDDKSQKTAFLNWAKQNNCKWINKVIDSQKDKCGTFMGIDSGYVLGYVGGHCWFNSTNPPQKIKFEDLIGE